MIKVPPSWPLELGKALLEKEAEFWSDGASNVYDNPDNFRVCRVGNKDEELAYQKAEELGCCGSTMMEWIVCGVEVRYGFNYGH